MENNNEEWRDPDHKGGYNLTMAHLAPCIESKGKIGLSLKETGEKKGSIMHILSTDLGVNIMNIQVQPGGEREMKDKTNKRSARSFSNSH